MPNQVSESEPEVGASGQAQLYAPSNASGSTVLDANIAARASTNPEGFAIANPITTNFSSGTGTGNAKTADASTVAEPNSADSKQLEKGTVHLQNNLDLADSDIQGTLPDTDPIELPLDTDVNHQQ